MKIFEKKVATALAAGRSAKLFASTRRDDSGREVQRDAMRRAMPVVETGLPE